MLMAKCYEYPVIQPSTERIRIEHLILFGFGVNSPSKTPGAPAMRQVVFPMCATSSHGRQAILSRP